ncbi:MAG: type I DNA topoisomerase [Nitrospirota bacterium]|nr:type I DNA topoisomerase [Nitrospirota bacterium]
MGKSLVIVESPAKAKTIGKYLGQGVTVMASVGHVRDLPEKRLGVDIENDFTPEYELIKGKGKVVAEIKKAAKTAEAVYLAPDPDREGEAIAWHIAEELDLKKKPVYRVLFNEITQKAIKDAMAKPGRIDQDMVDAQQARRVLDRLVGYQISPLLWKKVKRGLSAGRVQSVAVRLVCEREAEIAAFKPEEYWSVTATLEGKTPPPFAAKLLQAGGKKIRPGDEKQVKGILADLEGKKYTVSRVEKKETKRNPVPAFITSKLQQEAARKLRFTAKKTMSVAQGLYEGVEIGSEGPVGLITYMRTDSVRVSNDAIKEVRDVIAERYGKEFLPAKPVFYATGKAAQDAHEAIRPTSAERDPESLKKFLDKDQYNLYKLIWNRFMASQMSPALIDQTSVDVEAGKYLFRATGSVIKFPGFLKVYEEGRDDTADNAEEADEKEATLPPLEKGDVVALKKIEPKQHFTQPPPRYTEATLVKELEEKGIGRPSTYAAIMSTIQDREYVEKTEGKFRPTELGCLVNTLLVEQFPDLLDVEFTAGMEKKLDEIEEGKLAWVKAVKEFYGPFSSALENATSAMRNIKREEIPTDIVCEKCGAGMVIKWGRNGQFLACSAYPECKNTKEFVKTESGEVKVKEQTVEETGETCPNCGSPMVVRSGRFGKFIACSRYPECKTTKAATTGVTCPEKGCGGNITEKRSKKGKVFYSCSNWPKCKFAIWDKPLPKPCPQCKAPFLVEKVSKKTGVSVACIAEGCKYREGTED